MWKPLLSIILCAVAGCSEPNLSPPPNLPAPVVELPPATLPAVAPAAEGQPGELTAPPASRSASKASAADLRKSADDPRADRAVRAAAVFALFANHLKPPCGAAAASDALGEATWLAETGIGRIDLVAGLVPVEFGGDGTVYCLYLFPLKDQGGWSDWVIYLRLSGSFHSVDDLRAFFHSGKGLKDKPELVEFALCYPSPPNELFYGRVEHFGPKGLTVRDGE